MKHKSVKFQKFTSFVMTALLLFSIFSPVRVVAEPASETVNIQILATSDTHGRFLPYDYAINTVDNSGSLAQIATAVAKLRAENPNTIVVDNGDTIQDNSQDLFLENSNNPNGVNPMVYAMNEIGYDTWTFGNHEFNYGVDTLKSVSSKFNGIVLCGNVISKKDGQPLGVPYTIIEKAGVNICVIGMVTPNITKWDSVNLENYDVLDPVVETKKAIEAAKAAGADIFVAVEHMSLDSEYDIENSGAIALANACPELTAIVSGHGHATVKEVVNGVLIVEPGKYAQNLSKINITLTKKGNEKFSVIDKSTDVIGENIAMAGKYGSPIYYEVDTDLEAKLQPYHDIAIADANTVIGKLEGGDLVPADEVTGIPTSQIQPTPMIDLINKVQMHYGKQISPDDKVIDVSAAAAFRSDANILEGDIKKSDTSLIYKYDNTLYVLEVTGKQLKQYMEWSASYYNQYENGDLTVSFNPSIRGYNYDMFTGIQYNVDIAKPAGSRITNLAKMDGTEINDNDILRLAVNNYRANTQLLSSASIIEEDGEYPKFIAKSEDTMGDAGRIRDLIRDYIVDVKGGTITPECDDNWSISGNNWDLIERAAAVVAINEGKIDIPVSEDGRSWNIAAVTYTDLVNGTGVKRINILSFNDFHGALENSGKNSGIAKFAGEVNRVKGTNPDTIIVSAGDNFQGSSMSNLTYGAPVNEFMESIGVVASAVGNHEFDWGVDRIPQWATDGGYDYLASNIYDKATGAPVTWAKPYIVKEVDGIKIGLIGLTTPETEFKTLPANVANLEFKDPIQSARTWATKLKDGSLLEGKVDVVLALTHLGAFQDYDTGVITGEAADLANANTGVDGIISGHTHTTVEGSVNDVAIVQAYKEGRSMGRVTISIDNSKGNVIGVTPFVDALYKRADTLVEDDEAKAIYEKYLAELEPILGEVLGTTDKELTHDKMEEGTSVLGAWVCDVMREEVGTEIAITNGGGLRTSIEAGDITMGEIYEVMPFDNTLVKMNLKGSDLKKAIENGIGNDSIGWVQVSGLKVYYDLTRDFGDRITAMVMPDGKNVDMNVEYSVVTNDFMFTGGDQYDFSGASNVVNTQVLIRDALVSELREVVNLSYEYDPPLINGVKPDVVEPEDPDGTEDSDGTEDPGKTPEVIDITSVSIINKSVFQSILGQDKTIKFVGTNIAWIFNGLDLDEDIVNSMEEIDLSLEAPSSTLKDKIEAKVKSVLDKDVPVFQFSFKHDGELPGKATITVFVGDEWANKTVDISIYYSDKNIYETIETKKVDDQGNLTFTLDHCSDYFITDTAIANLPKTGSVVDTKVLVGLGLIIIAAGVGIFVKTRKKDEEEEEEETA